MKLRIALFSCLLAASAFAADVTGKWTAEVQGRGGQTRTMNLNLKADGSTLTGTVGGPQGDVEITNGKVDGDNVSFTIVREFNGNTVKMNYKGTVSGDSIKFTQTREGAGNDRPPQEFTAKRSTT